MERPTKEQIGHLKRFTTAAIHEAQGKRGALHSAIKPLDPSFRLAGPALTVDARPSDNLIVHYAMTKARAGDVLVVDAKGFEEAGTWGDVLSMAAQLIGIAGYVIDGAVRDANGIISLGFPVFARALSIKGTNKCQPGHINVPIICGGVDINPGDLVVGDRDGVVVVAADELDEVIAACEAYEAKEEDMRARIRQGKTTVDILGLGETLRKFNLT
jgi:4-hydroxy-4-methyl-2-oxoglutarate aldolase